MARSEDGQGAAVLCSGGLDSAVLLADVARREAASRVLPIYVSVGLAWEPEEIAMIDRLLGTPPFRGVLPIATLRFDMRDVYPPTHWAIRGEPPGFDTPDEDVYLEGRNIVLLTKAAVFMARARLTRLYIGPLAGNPFPDATPEFFATMARALSLGLAAAIEIAAPFADMAQGRGDRLGTHARRAARADALVHAAGRRAALRPLQQVSRTKGRIPRVGDRRSDELRRMSRCDEGG